MEALRLKELVEGSGAGALEVDFICPKLAIPDYSRPSIAGLGFCRRAGVDEVQARPH